MTSTLEAKATNTNTTAAAQISQPQTATNEYLLSAHSPDNFNTVEDLDIRLRDIMVRIMKEICADTERRLTQAEKDAKALSAGIYYTYDYCDALIKKKQQARLKSMLESDAFINGYAPKEYFTIGDDARTWTGKGFYAYELKKGKLPSDAVKALQQGLTLLACGEVTILAAYLTLLEVIGKEKFDAIFAANSPTPLKIRTSPDRNPITILFAAIQQTSSSRFKKGDIAYIANIPRYQDKHFRGPAKGYNLVCCGKSQEGPKFVAFGLNSNGVNFHDLQTTLIAEYNKTPIINRYISKKRSEQLLGEDFAEVMQKMKALENGSSPK